MSPLLKKTKRELSQIQSQRQPAIKGYEIRARKRSARDIIVNIRKRLRSSEPDYYLKPNSNFKSNVHQSAETRNQLK